MSNTAEVRGRKTGRKLKATKAEEDSMLVMHEDGTVPIYKIAELFKISKPTFYSCIRRAAARRAEKQAPAA